MATLKVENIKVNTDICRVVFDLTNIIIEPHGFETSLWYNEGNKLKNAKIQQHIYTHTNILLCDLNTF